MCVLYVSFGSRVRASTFGCVAMGSVTAFEHSPSRPIGNSIKLLLIRGLRGDCDRRTGTTAQDQNYFLERH